MHCKKEKALVVSILIMLVQITSSLYLMGYFMNPVVICISDDNLARDTAKYLSNSLDNCPVIETDDIHEINRITTHAFDTVFYVGHGTEKGIESKRNTIEWDAIGKTIIQSLSNEHMILACNSENLNVESTTKTWITFPGLVDAKIASDITLALHFMKKGDSARSNAYGQLATIGYLTKVVLGVERQAFLGIVYDDGGGGTGSDWDFYYRGVYFDSYDVNPSNEVYYDHPSYQTYYRLLGVGVPDSFTVGDGYDLKVNHIDRNSIILWKMGGLLGIAELLVALGIAAAASVWGIEASPIILAFAAILGIFGFTVAYIVESLIEDEMGGGWVFYKDIDPGNGFVCKLGMGWWFIVSELGGIIPFPCDGHYVR